MPLKWTKNKPAVSGWYFVKVNTIIPWRILHVVEVYITESRKRVFDDGKVLFLEDPYFVEWSDNPIDPPTESDTP
jgi:hypothetical protein